MDIFLDKETIAKKSQSEERKARKVSMVNVIAPNLGFKSEPRVSEAQTEEITNQKGENH